MEIKYTLLNEQLANREIHLVKMHEIFDIKNECITFWEHGYKKLDKKLIEMYKDKQKNEKSLINNLNKVKQENIIQKQQLLAKQEENKLLCEKLSNPPPMQVVQHRVTVQVPLENNKSQYDDEDMFELEK